MNITKLRKQVEEIDKRVVAGETVRVNLTGKNKLVHLKVNETKASHGSRKEAHATSAKALGVGAAGDQSFNLDFSADDITDAQIVANIKKASGSIPSAAAGFNPLPVVTLTRNDIRGVWILAAACSYVPDNIKPLHTITVAKHFEFDLASIPRIFWSILAPEELSLAAPLFHDLLYRRGGKLLPGELAPPGYIFKRAGVDALFLELMTKAGIPKWKGTAAYWAVRGFSGFAWKE
jgi:hypothetical protein